METMIPRRGKVNPAGRKRKPDFRKQVLAALLFRGMTLRDWSELSGYKNSTQVSLALNGHRRHPKARQIVAALRDLVKGQGR
jgi:lambda repressor-like predicted transcriptional regulator